MRINKEEFNFIHIFMFLSFIMLGLIDEYLSCIASVILCIYLGYLLSRKRKLVFYLNITSVTILVFVFSYAASVFWAIDYGAAIIGFFKFMPLLLFLIVLMQSENDSDDYLKIIPYIACGMTIISTILMQIPSLEKWFSVAGRLSGFFQYSNTFALFLLIALIIDVTKKEYKPQDLLMIFILLFGIVYSGSRTVFVLMLVSIFILILFWKNKKIKLALLITFILIISGVFIYVSITGNIQTMGRFLTISLTDSTFVGRLLYYMDAIPVILSHPFGLGYLGYYYIQESIQTGMYSVMFIHNDFLQFMLDIGWIPALLVILTIIKAFFKKGSSLRKRLLLFVISAHCCFDFDLQYIAMFMLLLIILDYKDGKVTTISFTKVQSYVTLSVISILCAYIGFAQFLSNFNFTALSTRFYPWNTQDNLVLLANEGSEELADKIIKQNPYISVAYSIKADYAYENGDLEKIIEYQNKAMDLSKYYDFEYIKYSYMLMDCADFYIENNNYEKANTCLYELRNIVNRIDERTSQMSNLGEMIKDQPTTELPEDILQYIKELTNQLNEYS